MSDNYTLGMNAKLYFDTTALTGSDPSDASGASWTELTNCRDVTLNLEKGEADVTTRANTGWRATAGTLKNGTIEFQMQWKPSDAGFTAIKNAWLNGTEIALACLDGSKDTAGKQGLVANFNIVNFTRGEPLEEAISVSVTAKPSSYPQWYTVSS